MTDTVNGDQRHSDPFDHRTDPDMRRDQFPAWDALREQCPAFVNVTSAPRPVWYLTRYEDVHTAFQRPDLFSSQSVEPFEPAEREKPPFIPVEIDPPLHSVYRDIVAPFFTPRAVAALEPEIRALCIGLIEPIQAGGECEFVGDFAKRFPTTMFMKIMGLPIEDADNLLGWIETLMHTRVEDDPDFQIRQEVLGTILGYLGELFARRRGDPRDDVVTAMVRATVEDGRHLTDQELLSMGLLLYMAGLDTVAGALGYMFRYLAGEPRQRADLAAGRTTGREAAEELLRMHSIVNTGRVVTQDVEFAGCPMREGDRVVLATAAANRDPAEFDRADEVVIGRRPNRHIAYGAGPHRCLGSHLARLELAIALEEWHARIPDYGIPPGTELVDRAGSVSGLDALPLHWPV